MSVRFTEHNDRLDTATGLPTTTWTVTFWAYLVSDRNANQTFMQVGTGGTAVWVTTATDGTTLRAESSTTVGGTAMTVATWYKVALTFSSGAATFYAAADGSALTSASGSIGGTTTPTNLRLGSDDLSNWADCRLAAVKMWSAALTQTEIEKELAQFNPARTADLLRSHPFHVAELTDYSGNGNNLTAGPTATTTEADPPIPDLAGRSQLIAVGRRTAYNY